MGMTQTATVQARRAEPENDPAEPVPTGWGVVQPILVDDLAGVSDGVKKAAKAAGVPMIPAHAMTAPGVELDVADIKGFFTLAKQWGAARVYVWPQPLHAKASTLDHQGFIEDALSNTDTDSDDPEEQEAQKELIGELKRARTVLDANGTLVYGMGFITDGLPHCAFVTEDGLVDALQIVAALIEDAEDDDDDDLITELEPEEAAKRIVEHVYEEMEASVKDVRRRANEFARQAANQLADQDDLSAPERVRLQQAVKIAAVRLRKGL